jgi:hypothetical protein
MSERERERGRERERERGFILSKLFNILGFSENWSP